MGCKENTTKDDSKFSALAAELDSEIFIEFWENWGREIRVLF